MAQWCWCKLKDKYCSMATIDGYCQVTACIRSTEQTPTCNDDYIPDGYIPIKWLKTKTIDELCTILEDWEKKDR